MDLQAHKKYIKRHGLGSYLFRFLYRLLGRTIGFKALRGVLLTKDTVDPVYLEDHPELQGHAVHGSDLKLLVDDQVKLPAPFIDTSIERGDWCYLFRSGNNIASYGWYASQTCPVLDNVSLHFSSHYVYMFKGFTAPEHRGQRLHAYGMAHALEEAIKNGYKGLVSYIEADNAPSLKSSLRLGYDIFGTCFLFRIFGKSFTLRTPGCRQYGFYLELT